MTPYTDLFTAISKPLRVNRNALVTFPKYGGATKRHIFRNSTPTRNTKMATAKPVINIYSFIKYIQQRISASFTPRNEISTANPQFLGSSNSMAPLRILSYVTGSRFFKMEAAKQEVLIYIGQYSQWRYSVAEPRKGG